MFRDKRGNKAAADIHTLIAAGTTIRGDVVFEGGLHLEGTIEGSVRGSGEDSLLTLGGPGRVVGEIHVGNAVIDGSIEGDLHVSERLELAGKAFVEGNVHYQRLTMAEGARVNGRMVHHDGEPRQLPAPCLEAPEPAGA